MTQAILQSSPASITAQPLPAPAPVEQLPQQSSAVQIAQKALEPAQEIGPSLKKRKITLFLPGEEPIAAENPEKHHLTEEASLDRKRKPTDKAPSSEEPSAKMSKTQEDTTSVNAESAQKALVKESVAPSIPSLEDIKTKVSAGIKPWHGEMIKCLDKWYYPSLYLETLNEDVTFLQNSIDKAQTLDELKKALTKSKKNLTTKSHFIIGDAATKLTEGLTTLNQVLELISAGTPAGKTKV